MPELIPIEGDPFAGYNFRAVVGGLGQQPVASAPDAPAARVSTSPMSDNAPPVTLTPVDGNPFTPAPPASRLVNCSPSSMIPIRSASSCRSIAILSSNR